MKNFKFKNCPSLFSSLLHFSLTLDSLTFQVVSPVAVEAKHKTSFFLCKRTAITTTLCFITCLSSSSSFFVAYSSVSCVSGVVYKRLKGNYFLTLTFQFLVSPSGRRRIPATNIHPKKTTTETTSVIKPLSISSYILPHSSVFIPS